MKHPYGLSTSNKIFATIVTLIIIGFNLLLVLNNSEINFAKTIGITIGTIIGVLLIPFALSLFTWFVSGRKKNGGTVVFNVVLGLVLMGQLTNYTKERPFIELTS